MNSAAPAQRRCFATVFAVLALGWMGLLGGGCASYSPQKNFATLLEHAPTPRLVAPGREFVAADRYAQAHEREVAFAGVGSSMEPMYTTGTAIVVRQCEFDALRKGQPVVYINRRGAFVAHMLLDNTPRGWTAIGVNNTEADEDLVTPANLIGVIQEAFVAADMPLHPQVAARVALRDALERGASLASAAGEHGAAGLGGSE